MESNHYKDGYVPYPKSNEERRGERREREMERGRAGEKRFGRGGGRESMGMYC